MQHRPVRSGRYVVLIGLAAALAFGICGYLFIREKIKPSAPDLRKLDAAAQPFFDAAVNNIPVVVRKLTTTGSLVRLCWLMAKDRLGNTHHTSDYLEQVLREPIISPCQRGAAVYGCGIDSAGLARSLSDVHRYHAVGKAYALSGLTLEALLLKTTLASLRSVLGATVARFSAICGSSAACAAADGPSPIGDAIGAVLAIGGTAWCSYDLYQASKQLPQDLSAALHQGINDCREACRREVLK